MLMYTRTPTKNHAPAQQLSSHLAHQQGGSETLRNRFGYLVNMALGLTSLGKPLQYKQENAPRNTKSMRGDFRLQL